MTLYFIYRDFLGFPLDVVMGEYEEFGDEYKLINNRGILHLPKTIKKYRKHFKYFKSFLEILEYRICCCNNRYCEYNEELWRIANDKIDKLQIEMYEKSRIS